MKNKWVSLDLEQALPILSGFFSLNDVYTKARVVKELSEEVKD